MPKHYRYNLGIDLGIASIGTALVLVDDEGNPTKVLDLGARIFSVPEGASERRVKRLERKHIRRKRQRLSKLKTTLHEYGLLPKDTAQLRDLIGKNPYELRAHGACAPYRSLFELGRSLLHMAKFRGAGFMTQLEESEDSEVNETPEKRTDSPKTATAYRLLEKFVKESGKSMSAYLAQRLEARRPVRRRQYHVSTKEIEYAVPRFLVKDEFRAIWKTQAQHFTALSPELEEQLYQLIFGDHPHAPYSTGFCTLIPAQKRLPKMHRLAEQRRIYEQLANVRYTTAKGQFALSKAARDHLAYRAFEEGANLSGSAIRKYITMTTEHTALRVNFGEESKIIRGFCQNQAFADIAAWQDMSQSVRDELIDFISLPAMNPEKEHSVLYPEEQFLEIVCARLHLSGPEGERKASTAVRRLAKGMSMLGMEATQNILEKLIAGQNIEITDPQSGEVTIVWKPHTHRTAADACGYEAEEEALRKKRGTYAKLPYYAEVLRQDVTPVHPWHIKQAAAEEATYGRIPNPVVHVALNQLRKVVNEIVSLYGKPQRIHVELARELGMSAARREEVLREMQKREREHAVFDKELVKLGLLPNRKNRTKYRLWQEQGGRSLYTMAEIQQKDIAACEIDHLIPRSHGGSDSYMNMTLVHSNENFGKNDTFPYEFIQKHAPDAWQHISSILAEKKFPKAKAWRFSPDASIRFTEQGDEDATDSRLNNTSYMAKMAARYLSMLCANVVAVKGGITAQLRHLWGLDGIEYSLFGLPIREFAYNPLTGEVCQNASGYPQRNPLWVAKPRIDHRHHALDALVAACTTRGMVSRMVRAEKNNQRLQDIASPFGGDVGWFRQHVLEMLHKTVVSPKKKHGKAGQLHDATKCRILQQDMRKNSKLTLIRYKRKIDLLKNKNNVRKIMPSATVPPDLPAVKAAFVQCKSIINAIETRYIAAEDMLKEERETARMNGSKIRELSTTSWEEAVVAKAVSLARQAGALGATYPCLAYKKLVAVNKKLQFGFAPQNNYCMHFFEDNKGEIGCECITRIDANNNSFVPDWKKQGNHFIWSLCIDDVIEVEITPELKKEINIPCPIGKCLLVVQKMSNNKLQCNLIADARPLDGRIFTIKSGTDSYEEYKRWNSGEKGLDTWCQVKARKVDISPFGKIVHKHKKLWHGKKTT